MGHGGRWSRATAAARTAARGISGNDRVSLVTFGATAAQLVEPGANVARFDAAVEALQPSSEPTRYGAGFRMAGQILAASEAARKEIVLISDFHRAGLAPNDAVSLPPRTTVRTVDVSRGEANDVAVAHVASARHREGNRGGARATVTARLTNLGSEARTVTATLELAGRAVQSRRTSVAPRGTAQVVFAAAPVAATPVRGVIGITADSQPANDRFYFTVADELGASVLVLEPSRPRANQSLFLSRAWAVADDPPVRVDVKPGTAFTEPDMRSRSLFVLNEADLPAGARSAQLRAQVEAGAILLVVPGEGGIVSGLPEWTSFLPATVGPATARAGGRWASVDFSNALFEPFKARADFSSVAVTRYRSLTPANGGAVIARLDDGAPLLVERVAGAGRVMVWASSLDAQWTDVPFHPLWVPLLHQLARRSLAGRETRPWFTAPHVLDIGRQREMIVESPSGERIRVAPDSSRPSVELRERGFYELRDAATAIGAGQPIAVNVDLAESDLSHVDAAELVASITTREERGTSAARPTLPGTEQELERQQAVWWYLLLGAMLLLAAETIFSNRLSRVSARHPVTGVS
jgi:hypothetical protein